MDKLMDKKEFIFSPGIWLGEGKITLASSPEVLLFYTKWKILEETNGVIKATQHIQIQGIEENRANLFTITDITPISFTILLENELTSKIVGLGKREEQKISWEFLSSSSLEGGEAYNREESGVYLIRGKYGDVAEFSTAIEGRIWHIM